MECSSFAAACINDVLIFSVTLDYHISHIRRVLQALRRTGLTAKLSKYDWDRRHITSWLHLGLKMDAEMLSQHLHVHTSIDRGSLSASTN